MVVVVVVVVVVVDVVVVVVVDVVDDDVISSSSRSTTTVGTIIVVCRCNCGLSSLLLLIAETPNPSSSRVESAHRPHAPVLSRHQGSPLYG